MLNKFMNGKTPHTQFSKYKPLQKQSFTSNNLNKI